MRLTRNVLVGAFLIGGIILFGAGLFLIGSQNKLFSHTFTAFAYFANVNGLISGAQVHVSGLDAGSVSDIDVPQSQNSKYRVKMNIQNKFRNLVRQSSVASIASQGMVGDEFIEIDPGQTETAACSENCTIRSVEPFTLNDLLKQGKGMMQTLDSTVARFGDVANHADQTISTFNARGQGGETGPQHLAQTVVDAQRAANNVAEDTEALKHNFFLRGFFKKRGFYSLGQMTAEQYRKSDFVKEKKSERVWVPADQLFRNQHGKEELTEAGRKALDEAMAKFVPLLPNKPLMVEGYASQGEPAEQYRKSEERATLVRDYLMMRFQLKPENTGAMPLSSSPPDQTGRSMWDGVSLVMLT